MPLPVCLGEKLWLKILFIFLAEWWLCILVDWLHPALLLGV